MQYQPCQLGYANILVQGWLMQKTQDQQIAYHRLQKFQKQGKNAHLEGRHIREISQKLNRLERNFLRESEMKKEQNTASTVNHSYMQLDEIYKKASAILPDLKGNNRQEGKQLTSQIVSLYNCSVAELSRRQKLQKQLKAKITKKKKMLEKHEKMVQQKISLQKQMNKVKADHWLKIQQFKGI